jgi:hypothetical protein
MMAHSRSAAARRDLLLWPAAVLLAAALAVAAWGDKVALGLSPEIGDKAWYRLSMDGTTEISGSIAGAGAAPAQAMPAQIEIVFSVVVKSKDDDSNLVLEQRIHDLKMTAMGLDMSQMLADAKGAPITVTQDRYGNVVKVEGLPVRAAGGPMNPAGFTAVTLAPRILSYPEGEIDVGDTWEVQSSQAAKKQLKQTSASIHATLVALEEKEGQPCAKIRVVSKAAPELEGALPGSQGAAKVSTETDAVFYVRVSDGKVLSMDGTMKTDISSGGAGGFSAKTDMKLSMVETQAPTGAATEGVGGEGSK